MGRKPILPTQAQRRLLGLIVGGMAIERTGPVAYLLGPEPGREYLTRVSVATFEKLRGPEVPEGLRLEAADYLLRCAS